MSDADVQQSPHPRIIAREEGAEPSFELQEIAWDWQPDGQMVARGKLSVTRGDESRPVVLNFELPVNGIPQQPALKNPRDWVVTSLRRVLRR